VAEELKYLLESIDALMRSAEKIAHEYPLDLRERLENVTLAIEAFERIQSIYARIVSAR